MATSQDIRRWAAENGYQLKPMGPPTKAVKAAYASAFGDPEPSTPDDDGLLSITTLPPWAPPLSVVGNIGEAAPTAAGDEDQAPADPPPPPPATSPSGKPGTAGERPPTTRKQRWRDKWRQRAGQRPTRGRASQEKLITLAWSGLAKLTANRGSTVPLSRLLYLQAPVAGIVLDEELRGGTLDTLLQPAARFVNRSSKIGSLIALPVMVQIVTLRPDLYDDFEEAMLDAVYSYQEIAGPALEKRRKAMERRAEKTGGDAREFLAGIFAPIMTPAADDAAAA